MKQLNAAFEFDILTMLLALLLFHAFGYSNSTFE